MATSEKHIFLSYPREDATKADAVYEALVRVPGANVWYDRKSLRGGDDWRNAVSYSIAAADCFVLLWSSSANRPDKFIHTEISLAFSQVDCGDKEGNFFIPARLDNSLPSIPRANERHFVDLFLDWDIGIQNLIKSIVSPDERREFIERITSQAKEFLTQLNQLKAEKAQLDSIQQSSKIDWGDWMDYAQKKQWQWVESGEDPSYMCPEKRQIEEDMAEVERNFGLTPEQMKRSAEVSKELDVMKPLQDLISES